ncbi:MAG: hypothetical protein ABIK95_07285 [Acidobacteriota bacterium]|nr:hypothetical protein [Acidobacteriota bacterium]MBU4495437.1 hypothetical protein [Acidobacteriota bacterium]MCG2815911.1 hypothetical protein [Candidatus Aminicenantes bacterium]
MVTSNNRSPLSRFLFWILICIQALYVLTIFIQKPGMNHFEKAKVIDLIYGDAHKPFVYRVLLPSIIRTASGILPRDTKASTEDRVRRTSFVRNRFQAWNWEVAYALEYVLTFVLMYLSLVGFVIALRYLFLGLYKIPPLIIDLTCVAALGVLPAFFKYTSFLYDFPILFLFTLGLGLLARKRWGAYILVFTLGCLNKETTVLLVLVYIIFFYPSAAAGQKIFFNLLVMQMLIFGVIKIGLFFLYLDNPGGLIIFHLIDHNLGLIKPYPPSFYLIWAALFLLLFYKWKEKPLFLKQALWIAVPLIVSCLFFGYLDELRDYYELYPIVLLLMVHSAASSLRIPFSVLDKSRHEVRFLA